jgi:hypothetical protein
MSLNTIKRSGALLLAVALSLTAAACGTTTVTTGNFKGESHAVAHAIAEFQTDATNGDQKKVCHNDLAQSVQERLKSSGGCERAVKSQLQQIDNFNMTIGSIKLLSTSTATATVASTHSGKSRVSTLQLVKEGKSWKLAAVS